MKMGERESVILIEKRLADPESTSWRIGTEIEDRCITPYTIVFVKTIIANFKCQISNPGVFYRFLM